MSLSKKIANGLLGFGSVMYILTGLVGIIPNGDFLAPLFSGISTVSLYGYVSQYYCGWNICPDHGLIFITYLITILIGVIGLMALIGPLKNKKILVWGIIIVVLSITTYVDITSADIKNKFTYSQYLFNAGITLFWYLLYLTSYVILLSKRNQN